MPSELEVKFKWQHCEDSLRLRKSPLQTQSPLVKTSSSENILQRGLSPGAEPSIEQVLDYNGCLRTAEYMTS